MFYKVKNVTPLDDFILLVIFENGKIKKYDIRQLFDKWHIFQSLKDVRGLYNQVKVDAGGYGVSWPLSEDDDLDLACNELYFQGYEI